MRPNQYVIVALLLGVLAATPASAATEALHEAPAVWAIVRTLDPTDKVQELAESCDVLAGVVYYTSLRTINPAPGVYDWSGIDRILGICQETGKQLKLAILGGRWVPEWLYEQGAQKITWNHYSPFVECGERRESAPVPWDPVYLGCLEDALTASATRYGEDPLFVEIQVTGPALANGLELAFDLSPEQGGTIGYEAKKLVGAWKRMIDFCATTFPKQSLSLALHNKIMGEYTIAVSGKVRDYGLQQYGLRLHLLVCYATYEPWFRRGNSAVDVWVNVPSEIIREAQLIDIFSVKEIPVDKIVAAIGQAHALGASSVEVFVDDLFSENYRNGIEATLKKMASPSL